MIRFALLLTLALVPPVIGAQGPAPPLNVGDTWMYQIDTPARSYKEKDTVVAVRDCGGGQCYVLHSESQGETNDFWITKDWELIRNGGTSASGSYNFTYSPPLPIYVFPLEVGKNWSWNSTFSGILTSGSENQTYTGTIAGISRRVASKETVTVPAGEFEVFLVEHLDDKYLTRRLWFSERVREAVKFEFYERGRSVLTGSLLSYSLAEMAPSQSPSEYAMAGVAAVVVLGAVLLYRQRARSRRVSESVAEKPKATESEP